MPNRILKDSIRTSDTIDSLSWFQEVFFYRLIVSCDDYGRFDARPKIIKGALFPLKDVTENQITDALNKLSSVGMVKTYMVNSRPYLQITTWARHQQIRSQHAKYPGPDEADDDQTALASNKQADDINGYQMISGDIRFTRIRNPIQSESESNPKDILPGKPDKADPGENGENHEPKKPEEDGLGKTGQETDNQVYEKTKDAEITNNAHEVIDYLNMKTGSKYRYSRSSMVHLVARLREGFTVDDCKTVIDKKCSEWLNDPYMSKFLRPETLFAGKFEGYLNQQMQQPGTRTRPRKPVDDDLPF